jgi:predicted transcriptional regulator
MARPRGGTKPVRISVSLDDQAHSALLAIASREDVSLSWLIRRAVNELIGSQASEHQTVLSLPRKAALTPRVGR